jgi:hypothetical protein
MRSLLLGDVVAAARALRRVDAPDRPELLRVLVEEASVAARHGRETGRNHPDYGDGSLMAAALRHDTVPEPSLEDRGYRLCLALVLVGAVRFRPFSGQSSAPGTRDAKRRPPLSS